MNYHQLGRSGISVSAVAMGCWVLAGDATWGPQDRSESIATIHAALEAGVTLFDTAEGYGGGDSEEIVGQALAGRRHEAVIATKVSRANLSAAEVRRACENSLRRLQTDYVDLYQIHWPSRTVPLAETMEVLEQLRQEGKVRPAETNQLPYSLLWRAIEYEVQPACVDAGVGILCYSALAQGLLTGKFASADEVPAGRARTRLFSGDRPDSRHGQAGCETEVFAAIDRIRQISTPLSQPLANVALAWLLHQPGVTSVIAGARHPAQIQETARAADLTLSAETIDALNEATSQVKHIIGPDPDMWQSPSRFR
jgi:myo-inositol catabolism protein IolS